MCRIRRPAAYSREAAGGGRNFATDPEWQRSNWMFAWSTHLDPKATWPGAWASINAESCGRRNLIGRVNVSSDPGAGADPRPPPWSPTSSTSPGISKVGWRSEEGASILWLAAARLAALPSGRSSSPPAHRN